MRGARRKASGARITIGGVQQMHEIILGSNFVSQNPTVQVFGLGSAAQVDELRVEWPGAGVPVVFVPDTTLSNVAAGRTVTIDHPSR